MLHELWFVFFFLFTVNTTYCFLSSHFLTLWLFAFSVCLRKSENLYLYVKFPDVFNLATKKKKLVLKSCSFTVIGTIPSVAEKISPPKISTASSMTRSVRYLPTACVLRESISVPPRASLPLTDSSISSKRSKKKQRMRLHSLSFFILRFRPYVVSGGRCGRSCSYLCR